MPAAIRIAICCGTVFLASCVTPRIGGKYQLPKDDLRQIQHVLLWTIGIPKIVVEISGDDPTHAHAFTSTSVTAWSFVYLIRLEKEHGVWQILSKELFMVTGN